MTSESSDMNWLYVALALSCAGFIQGYCGFGFGMVSMALMPLFMSVKEASVISTACSLLATVALFVRHYKQYNWRLEIGFLLSVGVGLPVGVLFLQRGSESLLVRVLGCTMLLYAAFELFFPRTDREIPRKWAFPLGLFSGALSGAFNLGGVPSAAYAYSKPWSHSQVMAFLQVMITVSCLLRLAFFHQAGLLARIAWSQVVPVIIPIFLAIWLGQLAVQRLHPRRTRQSVFVFVAVSGIYYVFFR